MDDKSLCSFENYLDFYTLDAQSVFECLDVWAVDEQNIVR